MKLPLLLLGLVTALPSWGVIVIADPNMNPSDYSPPSPVGLPPGVTVSSFTLGSWNYIITFDASYNGFSPAFLNEMEISHSYNPAVNGPAMFVNMSIDLEVAGGPLGVALRFFFNGPSGPQSATLPIGNGTKTQAFSVPITFAPGLYTFGWGLDIPAGVPNTQFTATLDNFCVAVNEGLGGCAGAMNGSATPEPASVATLGGALAVLAYVRHRRK